MYKQTLVEEKCRMSALEISLDNWVQQLVNQKQNKQMYYIKLTNLGAAKETLPSQNGISYWKENIFTSYTPEKGTNIKNT